MCTVVQELYSTSGSAVSFLRSQHITYSTCSYVREVLSYESTKVLSYESTSVRCMILGGNRIGQGPTSASLSHGTIE